MSYAAVANVLFLYVTTVYSPSVSCPAGFWYSLGKCYQVVANGLSYLDAMTACYNRSSKLVTITSLAQNRWLYERLSVLGYGSTSLWIGLNDVCTENNYVWLDGNQSSFRNWASGEPNNAGGREDCGLIIANGKWNDGSCSSLLSASLCEYTSDASHLGIFCFH